MNRQVVAFLSLFSLVLVLSVYYVMLPIGVKGQINSDVVDNIIVNSSDPYIESIILTRTMSFEEVINAQLEVAGSSEYTASEKVKALETVAAIRQDMQVEENLRSVIKEAGFPSAFVEVVEEENYINILTVSKTKSNDEVLKIYDCVDSLFTNNQLQVYVNFR